MGQGCVTRRLVGARRLGADGRPGRHGRGDLHQGRGRQERDRPLAAPVGLAAVHPGPEAPASPLPAPALDHHLDPGAMQPRAQDLQQLPLLGLHHEVPAGRSGAVPVHRGQCPPVRLSLSRVEEAGAAPTVGCRARNGATPVPYGTAGEPAETAEFEGVRTGGLPRPGNFTRPRGWACLLRAQPRIQGVAERVAEQVEGEDGEADREAREDPPSRGRPRRTRPRRRGA